MTTNVPTVGIVGDGLASLAAAYNIAHQLPDSDDTVLNIAVIGPHAGDGDEPDEDWGKGPAYTSPGDLNVTTEKMGFTSGSLPVPDFMKPTGFRTWLNDEDNGYPALLRGDKGAVLQRKAQKYEGFSDKFGTGTYLPRRLEGLYIEAMVQLVTAEAAQKGVKLTFHTGKAVDADKNEKMITVENEGNGEIIRDVDVVLDATGNGTLLAKIPVAGAVNSEAIIENPWKDLDLPDTIDSGQGTTIVIYGTGPTFVDKMKELDAAGYFDNPGNKVVAISRHAFMPLPHAEPDAKPKTLLLMHFKKALSEFAAREPITAQNFSSFVENWIAKNNIFEWDEQGMPNVRDGWQDIMTEIRGQTQTIWSHLPENEKENFFNIYFGHWKALRNRMIPEDHKRLMQLKNNHQLELTPGSIVNVTGTQGALTVQYEPNEQIGLTTTGRAAEAAEKGGADGEATQRRRETVQGTVQTIINCTGPSRDLENGQPWHKNLLEQGLIQKGPANAGMRLATDGFSAAGSDGFILPVSGELLIGEKFEINGWQDLRKWVEQQAGHAIERVGLERTEAAKAAYRLQSTGSDLPGR